MSIETQIEAALKAGTLRRAEPLLPGSPEPRIFLMCQPLFEALEAGLEGEDEDRWAALKGDVDTFITGGYTKRRVWTPPGMQAFLSVRNGMWSGAVVCPAL